METKVDDNPAEDVLWREEDAQDHSDPDDNEDKDDEKGDDGREPGIFPYSVICGIKKECVLAWCKHFAW